MHEIKRFCDLTLPQQRQKIGGMRGQLAVLTEKDGLDSTVIIEDLATPGTERSRYQSRLICRDYYEGGLLVFGLAEISQLERRQWPITDRRHPDYEEQEMIVKPLDLKRGRR